jgi:hypothetical protein
MTAALLQLLPTIVQLCQDRGGTVLEVLRNDSVCGVIK